MDKSLRRYNKINANLGFVVDELRNKQTDMTEHIVKNRMAIRRNDSYIQSFKTAVYNVAQHIDDFNVLKSSVNDNLYTKYVKDKSMKYVEVD